MVEAARAAASPETCPSLGETGPVQAECTPRGPGGTIQREAALSSGGRGAFSSRGRGRWRGSEHLDNRGIQVGRSHGEDAEEPAMRKNPMPGGALQTARLQATEKKKVWRNSEERKVLFLPPASQH